LARPRRLAPRCRWFVPGDRTLRSRPDEGPVRGGPDGLDELAGRPPGRSRARPGSGSRLRATEAADRDPPRIRAVPWHGLGPRAAGSTEAPPVTSGGSTLIFPSPDLSAPSSAGLGKRRRSWAPTLRAPSGPWPTRACRSRTIARGDRLSQRPGRADPGPPPASQAPRGPRARARWLTPHLVPRPRPALAAGRRLAWSGPRSAGP